MNIMKFRRVGSPVSEKNPIIAVRFCQAKQAPWYSSRRSVIERMLRKGYVRCGARA